MNRAMGTCLAASVAALFLGACDDSGSGKEPAEKADQSTAKSEGAADMPQPKGDEVQCLGVHECKGKSACHVAGGHACAGQNECKGKGWIALPRAECEAKGGKVNAS